MPTRKFPILILSENPPECVWKKVNETNECPHFKNCEGNQDISSFCTNNQFNETEMSIVDHSKFYGHIYTFHNSKASMTGFIISNSNTVYGIGGCWSKMGVEEEVSFDVRKKIELEEAIFLCIIYSHTYYHAILEMLPSLILLRPLILQNPDIPILIRLDSKPMFDVARILAGLGHLELKVIQVRWGSMIATKKLYVAGVATCKKYPPKLIRGMNDYFYNNFKRLFPSSLERPQILLGQRSNTRKLEEFGELEQIIKDKYPGKVSKIDFDKPNIKDVARLFSQSDIFVSPHGAGFSNMLFMKNAILIEIIPDKYQENCFALLSQTLGLKRYEIMGTGDSQSHLVIGNNLTHLVETIDKAMNQFVIE